MSYEKLMAAGAEAAGGKVYINRVELAQGLITMSAKVTLAAGTHTASVRCDGRSGTISVFASIR